MYMRIILCISDNYCIIILYTMRLYMQFYLKIVQQKLSPLETALGKLVNLHKTMKKAQMPLALLDELLLVQKLIRTRIKLLSATS